MFSFWFITYLLVAFAAVLFSFLMVLHTWEHRRYSRNQLALDASDRSVGRVALVVPCKGLDFGLEDNLRFLFKQDYSDYEVIFVVESAGDPACRVIHRLLANHPDVPGRLVVAGVSEDCSQKIHNLRCATTDLPESIRVLAFADSDARPAKEWLRKLVDNIDRSKIGAVTSYRWFVPAQNTLPNLIMFSINSGVMALVATRRQAVVWGGTWAIRRELFEDINLHKAWERTLSDDLVVSNLLNKLQLRIAFEPRCVVTSTIDYDWSSMWEFLRRQLYIGRWYRPVLWRLTIGMTLVTLLGFWSSLALAAYGIATGSWWTWIPATNVMAMSLFSVIRAWWRQRVAIAYLDYEPPGMRTARLFDLVAFPITMVVTFIGLIGSAIGDSIQWRGIHYRMYHDGTVDVHRPPGDDISTPLPAPTRRAA